MKVKRFSDRQAQFLVAAGGILRARGEKIKTEGGENYPQAVLRVVRESVRAADLPEFREVVAWVVDYEDEERRQAQGVEHPTLAAFRGADRRHA